MEKVIAFRTIMNGPYRDHPHEDALERFILNQCEEEELEIVETHILACESCITRLETLELNIAATKLALQNLRVEETAKQAQPASPIRTWLNWLTLPRLSFAGAGLAACAFALAFVAVPRDIDVAANRGSESTVVKQWLPLDLHLDARDLPAGEVNVEVVDATGAKVWQGSSTVKSDKLEVKSSRLTSTGHYFVRVYSPAGELLREYSLESAPLF